MTACALLPQGVRTGSRWRGAACYVPQAMTAVLAASRARATRNAKAATEPRVIAVSLARAQAAPPIAANAPLTISSRARNVLRTEMPQLPSAPCIFRGVPHRLQRSRFPGYRAIIWNCESASIGLSFSLQQRPDEGEPGVCTTLLHRTPGLATIAKGQSAAARHVVVPAWKAETAGTMTCISPGDRCWLLSASDRGCPSFTVLSGTQRARPSYALRACHCVLLAESRRR